MRGEAKPDRAMHPEGRPRPPSWGSSALVACLVALCPLAAQGGVTLTLPDAIEQVHRDEAPKVLEQHRGAPAPDGWGRADPRWDHALPPAPSGPTTLAQCDRYRAQFEYPLEQAQTARQRCEQRSTGATDAGTTWMPHCGRQSRAACAAEQDRVCFMSKALPERLAQCRSEVEAHLGSHGRPQGPAGSGANGPVPSPSPARTPVPAAGTNGGAAAGLVPDWREQARTGLAGAIRDFERTVGGAVPGGRAATIVPDDPRSGSRRSAARSIGATDEADVEADADVAAQAANRAAMLETIERMRALGQELQQRQHGIGGAYGGAGRQAPAQVPSMRPPSRCGPGGCEVKN